MKQNKLCPICGSSVQGRTDKIFCSVKCKSVDQYEKRMQNERTFLIIDRQLKINRKILKRHNKSGYTTIRSEELLRDGFNPNFFTHYWKNKKGDVYLFVYEFGFLKLNEITKEKYLLITWQDYMTPKLPNL